MSDNENLVGVIDEGTKSARFVVNGLVLFSYANKPVFYAFLRYQMMKHEAVFVLRFL